MKRWTTILGRGGTVLIAISLALFLVSLIPSGLLGDLVGSTYVDPQTFKPLTSIDAPPLMAYYEPLLTPQQGLEMTITTNGTLNLYLLELDTQALFDWISEQQQKSGRDFNLTSLEAFLEAHSSSIGWQQEIDNKRIEHTYVPTKVTNATVIFSNPSSDNILVNYEVSRITFVAPGDKVRNVALWTTPIGIILALPWLVNIWKQRKQK